MRRYLKGILAFVSLGGVVSGGWVMAQSAPVKNIVLVHGAFADGSSWSKVIPLLQAKGYHVTSVAIPLSTPRQTLRFALLPNCAIPTWSSASRITVPE